LLIQGHGLCPHLYADDTQIYGFCRPSASLELQNTITSCVDENDDNGRWMRSNTAKTEILSSTTGRRSHQLPQSSLRVGTDDVIPTAIIRDLRIYISMRSHITKTVSASFAVLRQLQSVRRSVPNCVLQSLVTFLVLMRLDYTNATLTGIPLYLLKRLQSVMNSAARLVFSSCQSTPPSTALVEARERIHFKFALLAYNCQHGAAPSYLADELNQPANLEGRRRLHSASSSSLIVRRTRLLTIGDRAFPVAATCVWNGLPQHVTSASSLSVFCSRLKTRLWVLLPLTV